MASFYFRYGVMNSGKSVHLMQVAHNYEERDMKPIVLKPLVDTKGDEDIVSRVGLHRTVDFLIDDNKSLIEYLDSVKDKVHCILVDEAQFLKSDTVDTLYEFNKNHDIPVICYGLKNDFRTLGFPGSIRLFELADVIEELITICECGKKAKFSARIINDEYVLDGEQTIIDGDYARYDSLCGKCYLKKVLKINLDEK